MSATPQLDVVMYHFVRPLKGSPWPDIKGLEADDFDRQLDYLETTYDILTPQTAIAVMSGVDLSSADTPKRRACVLTFDDGYKDHHQHVLPRLEKRGHTGFFFPPACAALNRQMLDVNKIHFILASGHDPAALGKLIDDAVAETGTLPAPHTFRKTHHKAFGYDTADVIYVKRMLQHALPDNLRAQLTDQLFRTSVSNDPTDFADALYCNVDELKEMHAAGHIVGSHGNAHVWLNEMDAQAQENDIKTSLRLLDAVGISRSGFSFCYPYGGYNAHTLSVLSNLGCAIAFTTQPQSAAPGTHSVLEIPRLDTNAFPPRTKAAPFLMAT